MAKYCLICGKAKPDQAQYCLACCAVQNSSSSNLEARRRGGIWTRAFDLLKLSPALTVPIILLFFIELLFYSIEALIVFSAFSNYGIPFIPPPFVFGGGVASAITSLCTGFLQGIFVAILVVEVNSKLTYGKFNLGAAWDSVSSRLESLLILSAVMGIVDAMLSSLPTKFAWILMGLTLAYFIGTLDNIFGGGAELRKENLRTGIRNLIDLAKTEPASLAVFMTCCLISAAPLLGIVVQVFSSTIATLIIGIFVSSKRNPFAV